MRKAAAYLYKGPIVGVNEYLDVEEFDVEDDEIFNSEYVLPLDKMLARNGINRDFYFVTPDSRNNEFYVAFGSSSYFIRISFIDKRREEKKEQNKILCSLLLLHD